MAAKATAFHFEGLPRVPAMAVTRSRAIARGLAGADKLRGLTARGLGRLSVKVEAVEPTPWRPGAAQHPSPESAFMLVRADGSIGCLTVERFFALALVRAALSAPSPPVLRPLSPSERGVLAAMVAGVLAGAGAAAGLRVSLERPRPLDERERVSLSFAVQASGASGTVTLDAPMGWFPSEASSLAGDRAAQLETLLRVRLAHTEIPGAAYLGAEVGDAVVFEGVSAPRDDQPWPCELWIGSKKTLAELLPDGDLRPVGTFVSGPATSEPAVSDKEGRGDRPGEGISPEGAAVLASAPVEIVAEIGRVPMRGDEVLGLINGVVLSLGERRRDMVTLRVGGRAWARGELVNVDDDLGVRITEIIRQR
jgi:flagellar motor switch/type III secretory pathway protein FliN